MSRKTGTIIYFNAAKGYGFITPDGGGADAFAHLTKCLAPMDELLQGQRVHCETQPSERKPGQFRAIGVQMLWLRRLEHKGLGERGPAYVGRLPSVSYRRRRLLNSTAQLLAALRPSAVVATNAS